MSCNRFEKYDLGKIGEDEFHKHLETCSVCQRGVIEDEQLLSRAKALKKPAAAPYLWTKIEQAISEEMQASLAKRRKALFLKKWRFFPAAALALILMGFGLFFLFRPGIKGAELLADSALRRIERRETRYERSIERLERNVSPQMADLDLDLFLLYRDRLDIIDEQIAQCREALTVNSGNAHIRRYLFAAFQDKKETLREIMRASDHLLQEGNLE